MKSKIKGMHKEKVILILAVIVCGAGIGGLVTGHNVVIPGMLSGIILFLLMYVNCIKVKLQCMKEEQKNRQLNEQLQDMKVSMCSLQEAYEGIEQRHDAKSKFLSRMSHDLRTPMNAIIGYSILLERHSDDPEKINHYANRIYLSGETLLEMINDALDMCSIESGNVKLMESEFSLTSVLDEVKAAVKPQVEAKRQIFSFHITNIPEVDLIVGDKQRFSQIIRNLLSNAIKYTPEGGCVDLIVNIIGSGNNNIQMLCQIKDNGCGMSSDFVKNIFLPFEREDTELNTSMPGTGLGMCITQSFVELMNGTISIDSKKGSGTLVTVSLPLLPAETVKKNMKPVLDGEKVLKGMRFLAAEDNESNAEILKEVLCAMGAECVIAEDGKAAVEAFEKSGDDEYDIILMDIQMPVMNGYQAAAAIRKSSHPMANDIMIVAMTADAFEEDVQRAFVSGMNAHVAKPLELQSFINTIKTLKVN